MDLVNEGGSKASLRGVSLLSWDNTSIFDTDFAPFHGRSSQIDLLLSLKILHPIQPRLIQRRDVIMVNGKNNRMTYAKQSALAVVEQSNPD